jgi:hypothetical protein
MSQQQYSAKFFDVAENIFPKYSDLGKIPMKFEGDTNKMIQAYVNKNKKKFHPGDILFVGSTYEGRQYDNGFCIIGNDYTINMRGEGGAHLPLAYSNVIPTNISYKDMLDSINEKKNGDEYEQDLYFNFYLPDDVYSHLRNPGEKPAIESFYEYEYKDKDIY